MPSYSTWILVIKDDNTVNKIQKVINGITNNYTMTRIMNKENIKYLEKIGNSSHAYENAQKMLKLYLVTDLNKEHQNNFETSFKELKLEWYPHLYPDDIVTGKEEGYGDDYIEISWQLLVANTNSKILSYNA